jgi:hypothetical protein
MMDALSEEMEKGRGVKDWSKKKDFINGDCSHKRLLL